MINQTLIKTLIAVVALVTGVTIATVFRPAPPVIDKVVDKKLLHEIDSLKGVVKGKDDALLRAVIKMQHFDSLARVEKEQRIKADVRSEMLKRALREQLRVASEKEKRNMILEYYGYEKDPS